MSMLAERKRKQKWSLNPRGKDWSGDSNKFGQKMLEKMGWQHGKGLGAKEDGITEHVKLSYKNDNKGMGYKETDDQWTEHGSNFTALLESLTASVDKNNTGVKEEKEIKLNSLEKKSQSSKVRVHYHKFTRGKDLSRYSEKDLANIFGRKSLKEGEKEVPEESNNIKEDESKDNGTESAYLFNAGSMRDYFKKKFLNFPKSSNGFVVGSNGVLKKDDSDSESEKHPSFGLGFGKETIEKVDVNISVVKIAGCTNSDDVNIRSKSKKQNKTTFISYINEETKNDAGKQKKKHIIEESNENVQVSPKKKHKKDKKDSTDTSKKKEPKKTIEEINLGVSNPAFNPLCTPVKIEKHVLNTIEENISEENIEEENSPEVAVVNNEMHEISIKALQKKHNANELSVSSEGEKKIKKKCEVGLKSEIAVSTVVTPKKKRKLNGTDIGTENPTFNNSVELGDHVSLEENPYEVKLTSKKKKKKVDILDNDNPNSSSTSQNHTDSSQIEENPYEVKLTSKKKKKKVEVLANDNPNFSSTSQEYTDSSQIEENPHEIKRKKKKKKERHLSLENPSFEQSTEAATNFLQLEENPFEIKLKSKKKKHKENKFAIDNPLFDENVISHNPLNGFEVERKKKWKGCKEVKGISNPALNLNNSSTSQSEVKENISINVEDCDLMLNIISTPIVTKNSTILSSENNHSASKVNSTKRKSVRFNDITQEYIIPNNEDLSNGYIEQNDNQLAVNTQEVNSSIKNDNKMTRKSKSTKLGLDNAAFDKQKSDLEENLDFVSKTVDRYQAEIENDINEMKLKPFSMVDVVIGEVGNPHGENEKLPEGTKLKFKHARLNTKTPFYQLVKIGPRKSYKHLIKGDIIVKFNNTNLHEIRGYAIDDKRTF